MAESEKRKCDKKRFFAGEMKCIYRVTRFHINTVPFFPRKASISVRQATRLQVNEAWDPLYNLVIKLNFNLDSDRKFPLRYI